ncbi:hypothetical protein [Streptomyces sp. PTD5-9]|uniref:hypothetical protein n=1 Tax=Streptomyces sp. PTD5-9 TaxID=3120150 RepID=UPI00300AE1CC
MPKPGRLSCYLALAAALVLSGCAGGARPEPGAPSTAVPGHSDPPPAGERAEPDEGDPAAEAARPVGGGRVLLSVASRRGNAELPLTERIGAGDLAVQADCRGIGALRVSVEPVGLSFPLECAGDEGGSTYHAIRLTGAHAGGNVRVTAPSTVVWALAVER